MPNSTCNISCLLFLLDVAQQLMLVNNIYIHTAHAVCLELNYPHCQF